MPDSEVHEAYSVYRTDLGRQGKTVGWNENWFSVFQAGWNAKAIAVNQAKNGTAKHPADATNDGLQNLLRRCLDEGSLPVALVDEIIDVLPAGYFLK